ncbi:hypothetical protein K438DRAFT_1960817 [Mycena galopus ATCC 62051]|nr:hypothetical protein K438DRAFT_1960817 [Mycena galopus ATCC 62051]
MAHFVALLLSSPLASALRATVAPHFFQSVLCAPSVASRLSSRALRALSHHAHRFALMLCAYRRIMLFVLCPARTVAIPHRFALMFCTHRRITFIAARHLSHHVFRLVLCAHRRIMLIASLSCSAHIVASRPLSCALRTPSHYPIASCIVASRSSFVLTSYLAFAGAAWSSRSCSSRPLGPGP